MVRRLSLRACSTPLTARGDEAQNQPATYCASVTGRFSVFRRGSGRRLYSRQTARDGRRR